jgi:hypothetical protein
MRLNRRSRLHGRADATAASTFAPACLEAHQIQTSRGDKTSIELFVAGARGWEARLQWEDGVNPNSG